MAGSENVFSAGGQANIGSFILNRGKIVGIAIGTAVLFAGCRVKKAHYACMEGTEFDAVFDNQHARLHIQNKDFDLPLVLTPVGRRYSDGKVTFGFKGKAAYVLEGDQMIDFGCLEKS